MSTPFSSQRPIADLLPHRPPMLLIDSIIDYQPDQLQTAVHIRVDSPFFDHAQGCVPNYVGIEYMAQTVAALAGIEAEIRGEPIRMGFLLGSRKLTFACHGFLLDNTYRVTVQRLYQEESGLAVFDCQIFDATQPIASANINVFQPQDTAAFVSSGSTTQ